MIVSASYKTDIPAFFGEWFRNRFRAGYCCTVNAFNRNQHQTVSLKPQDVDGFIFWSKNIRPFIPVLEELHELRIAFVIQHTVTGYAHPLEPTTKSLAESCDDLHRLRVAFGPEVAVWRYDPIILSSITPEEYHREKFVEIAKNLVGVSNEVVVSFVQPYRKTRRNLDEAGRSASFVWRDPDEVYKRSFAGQLAKIAKEHGMRLTMCGQPELLAPGVEEAHCVDAPRLSRISGRPIHVSPKGMRASCGCYQAKDIGEYDSCLNGCAYCYATVNRDAAVARFARHDPSCEYLFPPGTLPSESKRSPQLKLF